jgi:hypothetical protein
VPDLQYPTIDAAIQRLEGWFPGSLSYQNQNPGNIVSGSFAAQFGGVPGAGGFAQFPDLESGQAAEDALVGVYASQGLTIGQLAAKWTGGGAPASYAPYIATQAGADVNTPLSSLSGSGTGSGSGTSTANPFGLPFDPTQILTMGLGSTPGSVSSAIAGSSAGSSTWARAAAGIVGLILITVGLIGFDRTQAAVINVGKRATEAAAA